MAPEGLGALVAEWPFGWVDIALSMWYSALVLVVLIGTYMRLLRARAAQVAGYDNDPLRASRARVRTGPLLWPQMLKFCERRHGHSCRCKGTRISQWARIRPRGDVAKWQGSGLQNRHHRFESGRRLQQIKFKSRTHVLARRTRRRVFPHFSPFSSEFHWRCGSTSRPTHANCGSTSRPTHANWTMRRWVFSRQVRARGDFFAVACLLDR